MPRDLPSQGPLTLRLVWGSRGNISSDLLSHCVDWCACWRGAGQEIQVSQLELCKYTESNLLQVRAEELDIESILNSLHMIESPCQQS